MRNHPANQKNHCDGEQTEQTNVERNKIRCVRPSFEIEVEGINHSPRRAASYEDEWKRTKPQNCLGALAYHVCRTPVLNSRISGFRAAASRALIRASRVWAGSLMASTQ